MKETIRKCDVTGKTKGVYTFWVTVYRVPDEYESLTGIGTPIQWESGHFDLAPKALARLVARIEGGLKPPAKRVRKAT